MSQKILEVIDHYCVDTCFLIDLKPYFQNIFVSLWKNIEMLISQKRFIAPKEVLEELKYKDDEILRWAKNHKRMFKRLDIEQQNNVRNVLKDFPYLLDPTKETPDADPFIIALALKGYTVVTQEKKAKTGQPPKIPDACQHYKIKCINLYDLFIEQNWKF